MILLEANLKKRFNELGKRAWDAGRYCYSDFLTLAEQNELLSALPINGFEKLEGGYPMAERKMACFGNDRLCSYVEEPPIVCVCIEPLSVKFAETLTHRDYLGSLMGLGIKRETLGDIVLDAPKAYVFCTDVISDFICENLTQVRRTSVRASVCEVPEITVREPNETEINVASERIDAIIAAVYKLSRSDAASLIESELVFSGGKLITSTSATLKENDIISVRGKGRFVYCGIEKETRKGRLRVTVKIY